MNPRSLPDRWREQADAYERDAAGPQTAVLRRCAAEFEEAWREWESEELTLQEAAQESGYTAEHLGRLIREGTIPNVGEPYSPRILRRDLPKKPGWDGQRHPRCVGSKEQIARQVAASWEGESDA